MNRHYNIVVVLLVLIVSQAGRAEKLGVDYLSTGALGIEMLPDSLDTAESGVPEIIARLDSVQAALHCEKGYFGSTLEFLETNPGDSKLRVRLDQGPLTKIGRISFTGIPVIEQERLLSALGGFINVPASKRNIQTIQQSVSGYYAGRGYPFCVTGIGAAGIDRITGKLDLDLSILKKSPAVFGLLVIEGEHKTRPAVIARLSGFESGAPYDETIVRNAGRSLLASGLFSKVTPAAPVATADPQLVDIALGVDEFPGTRLDIALAGGGEGGSLAGKVNLSMNNLYGSARAVNIDWNRPRKEWNDLHLSYREPWLAGTDFSLSVAYSHEVRDSLYSTSGFRLNLERKVNPELALYLSGTYESSSPGALRQSYQLSALDNVKTGSWSTGGGLSLNRIDNPLNPAQGWQLETTADFGRLKSDSLSLKQLSFKVSSSVFLPLADKRNVLALSAGICQVSIGDNTPDQIPYHRRIPVGGVLSADRFRLSVPVRGYVEEEFRARRAGWGSLEIRRIVGPASRLFAFADFALANVPQNAPGWRNEQLIGYGGGIVMETRIGVISLALAFAENRTFQDGRLHVNLVERF